MNLPSELTKLRKIVKPDSGGYAFLIFCDEGLVCVRKPKAECRQNIEISPNRDRRLAFLDAVQGHAGYPRRLGGVGRIYAQGFSPCTDLLTQPMEMGETGVGGKNRVLSHNVSYYVQTTNFVNYKKRL